VSSLPFYSLAFSNSTLAPRLQCLAHTHKFFNNFRRSIQGFINLAEALSVHHAQQLRDFTSLVTSLLLRPMDGMVPPPLSSMRGTLYPPPPSRSATTRHRSQSTTSTLHSLDQRTRLFSTALAPLASNGARLPGPLPRVSLLTLEFENLSFEREFHSWKAECMQKQDLWSVFACVVVIIASVPAATAMSQLLQVGFILAAAAVTALLATRLQSSVASSSNTSLSFYCQNRDKLMLASTLCITAGVYLTGGGLILYNQVFALVAVLLPVRLRWQFSQLLLVLAWRIGCTTSVLSSPVSLMRMVLGVVIAPFFLAYVVEVVARRGFLSRQALVGAAADARARAEYDDDEYEFDDDDEEFDLYAAEDEDNFWLEEDDDCVDEE
jgi:hypothetical protein